MSKARKRTSRALRALLALIFAFAACALCLKVLTLSRSSVRPLSELAPRADLLDKPHRHRASPLGSASR